MYIIYVYIYIYLHIYACVCVCVYIYTYIHKNIHIYIYIYICASTSSKQCTLPQQHGDRVSNLLDIQLQLQLSLYEHIINRHQCLLTSCINMWLHSTYTTIRTYCTLHHSMCNAVTRKNKAVPEEVRRPCVLVKYLAPMCPRDQAEQSLPDPSIWLTRHQALHSYEQIRRPRSQPDAPPRGQQHVVSFPYGWVKFRVKPCPPPPIVRLNCSPSTWCSGQRMYDELI